MAFSPSRLRYFSIDAGGQAGGSVNRLRASSGEPARSRASQAAQSSSWASTSVAPSRSATSDSKSGSAACSVTSGFGASSACRVSVKKRRKSRAIAGSRAETKIAAPSGQGDSSKSRAVGLGTIFPFHFGVPPDARFMPGDLDQPGISLPPSTRLELAHGPRQTRAYPARVAQLRRARGRSPGNAPANRIRGLDRQQPLFPCESLQRRFASTKQNIRRASPPGQRRHVFAGRQHQPFQPDWFVARIEIRRHHPLLKLGFEANPLIEPPARGNEQAGLRGNTATRRRGHDDTQRQEAGPYDGNAAADFRNNHRCEVRSRSRDS